MTNRAKSKLRYSHGVTLPFAFASLSSPCWERHPQPHVGPAPPDVRPWFSYLLSPLCPICVPVLPALSTWETSHCLHGEVFPDLLIRNLSCQLSQPFLKASLKTLFCFKPYMLFVHLFLCIFSQLSQLLECGMSLIFINESMK